MIAMAIAVVVSLMFFGVPSGLLVAAVTAPLARRFVGRLESSAERRRRTRIAQQLPGAVDLLAAALDAGRPAVGAFALVAKATAEPLGSELTMIADRLAVTGDEQNVWDGLAARAEFAALGRSFRRAGRSGMPVARVLIRLADELRRERRAASQERARSVAVATAAPLGVCFLPAFFLIGIVPTILGTFEALPF